MNDCFSGCKITTNRPPVLGSNKVLIVRRWYDVSCKVVMGWFPTQSKIFLPVYDKRNQFFLKLEERFFTWLSTQSRPPISGQTGYFCHSSLVKAFRLFSVTSLQMASISFCIFINSGSCVMGTDFLYGGKPELSRCCFIHLKVSSHSR